MSEWKQKNSLFALCVFRLLWLCPGKQATPTCYAITAAIFFPEGGCERARLEAHIRRPCLTSRR